MTTINDPLGFTPAEPTQFACEIVITDPGDVPPIIAALAKEGMTFEREPDAKDPYSDAIFGFALGASMLPVNEIGDMVLGIIDRLGHMGGDVVEWGYGPKWKLGS